jgi:hypothetical protein
MRPPRLISLILFALVARSPARAQWSLTGDAGVSHLRQAGIPESNAQTLGATLDAAGERSAFRTSFLAARATSDRWTGQGLIVGSIVGPTAGAARWQLDGIASAFGETSVAATTSAEFAARARLGSGFRGGALGAGIGANMRGGAHNPLYRAQGDAWWSVNDERLVLNVALTHTRSLFAPTSTNQTVAGDISYLDLGATWRHDAAGLSIGGGGGLRGRQQPSGTTTNGWGVLDLVAWIKPQLALTLGAGRTLDDVVRGVPHAAFASVAIRIAAQPHTTIFSRTATVAGPRITVERARDDLRRIDVRVDSGSRVEIMGDFTNWAPLSLERAGAAWRVERAIPPGPHRIAMRIDGGPWIVPVNLPRVEDDLVGPVGIITIP